MKPHAAEDRKLLWWLVGAAMLLRVIAALPPAFHHADELWQYSEPAYHLARGGDWVQSWEMRAGARTWLIPAFLAPWMWIGHWFGIHLLLPKLALVALSLTVLGFAWSLGRAISRTHAWFAALVAATWFELVFFGPRALSEPVSMALILGAAWLLLLGQRSDRRVFAAGLLLGLAFAARFQCAPAIATLALWEGRTRWRTVWAPLILGGLLGLGIDAAIDAIMGQTPFLWAWQNFRLNLIEHRADNYGVSPPLWYLANLARMWSVALLPILILAWFGARRYPVLAAIALVHLAVHSGIAHKEYRFVLLSHALILILAGIGTAELIECLAPQHRRRAVIAASILWFATSIALALLPKVNYDRWGANREFASAIQVAGQQPHVCALALIDQPYVLASAYALYDQPTPTYVFRGGAQPQTAAFNVAILPHDRTLPGYRAVHCNDDVCVVTRPGTCSGRLPQFEINQVAAKIGE